MEIEKVFRINKYHSGREGHEYGLYAENTVYSFRTYWATCVSNGHFVSGNSFYELICQLFDKKFGEYNKKFHDFVSSQILGEERSLRFFDTLDSFSHRPNFDYYETWAKLLVKYLYEWGGISPFRYLKFNMKTSLGDQFFYFRGNSRQNIFKSFKYHFQRTHHLKHLMKSNLDDWIFKFYLSCINFNAMRADRFSFDKEAFINDCPFIDVAFQEEAFEKSNYYKRKVLNV